MIQSKIAKDVDKALTWVTAQVFNPSQDLNMWLDTQFMTTLLQKKMAGYRRLQFYYKLTRISMTDLNRCLYKR